VKKSTFLILCLEGAVLSFNVAACAALIPSISRDFLVEQFAAGRIIWLYMIPYGVAALAYGPLVRLIDAKKVELVCFFLFSLANLLAGLSRGIQSLYIARFLMGVFGASVIPLILILIAKHAAQERRGRMVGVFFGATFIASLLGLFLSGLLSWRLIFLIPAIAGFILWVFMCLALPSFKEDKGAVKVNYLAALKDRVVLSIFTYIFFISLIYHGIQQWLGVYFSVQIGLGQFFISMLITLTSLSGVFGEVIGGHFADSLGRFKTIEFGIIMMIVSALLLIIKLPVIILALVMIVWGLGWTFNHAGLSTSLTDLPREFVNEAASLNSGVRFIAGGLGAVIAGTLMRRGFVFGFSFFAVFLIILAISARRILLIK